MHARLKTTHGDIVLELDEHQAPVSVSNFKQYAGDGAYDGTIFHRVVSGFVIQGGGFEPDLTRRPTGKPIENEWRNELSNDRGTVAMARLGGQADSATNQFFINVADNHFLDQPRDGAGYAVFARVIDGMDVVDAIGAVATGTTGGMSDVPRDPVIIERVELDEAAD